jgi:hypothetical protein
LDFLESVDNKKFTEAIISSKNKNNFSKLKALRNKALEK